MDFNQFVDEVKGKMCIRDSPETDEKRADKIRKVIL